MYVLIVNEEPLGRSLARELIDRGHEVAYLDESAEFCNQVASELGCLVINGDTTNMNILREAGIERADIVVALLEKDIKNIMVGIFARQFKTPRILARLRQAHYRSAYQLAGIQELFSAYDFLLNKMLIAIEDPAVKQVMALGDGAIEIASLAVVAQSRFVGRTVSKLWEDRDYPAGALVLGVVKGSEQRFSLPREGPTLEEGDDLLVLGTPEDIHRIAGIVARPVNRLTAR